MKSGRIGADTSFSDSNDVARARQAQFNKSVPTGREPHSRVEPTWNKRNICLKFYTPRTAWEIGDQMQQGMLLSLLDDVSKSLTQLK